MKILIIEDDGIKREIRYSELSNDELDRRISAYEQKHEQTFQEFYGDFDSDESDMDELTDFLDWENLVEERKLRERKIAYRTG